MVTDGYLTEEDLPHVPAPENPDHRVDFDAVGAIKEGLFRLAFSRFDAGEPTRVTAFSWRSKPDGSTTSPCSWH